MADQEYVYKKTDNYIVLLFKLRLPANFKIEDQTELVLGFQMTTNSNNGPEYPFVITTPVVINVGAVKPD